MKIDSELIKDSFRHADSHISNEFPFVVVTTERKNRCFQSSHSFLLKGHSSYGTEKNNLRENLRSLELRTETWPLRKS